MSELERYSLVWQQCGTNGLAERFWVPGFDGFLPFFVSGTDLEKVETGEHLELTEFQLLAGILYGLQELDQGSKPWHRKEDRDTLTYLLDVLRNGFQAEDPEAFILDAAAAVRVRNGNRPSRTMLLTALDLIPFSSKIRSDLICDSWAVACENDDPRLIEDIPDWVRETALSQLIAHAKEIVCYYGLCSLVKLGEESDEVTAYLEEFVYPNIEMRMLKNKIKALLETPEAFALRDLRLDLN